MSHTTPFQLHLNYSFVNTSGQIQLRYQERKFAKLSMLYELCFHHTEIRHIESHDQHIFEIGNYHKTRFLSVIIISMIKKEALLPRLGQYLES